MTDFLLLGTVELQGADGAAVDLRPAKQRTGLAALLVDADTETERPWVASEFVDSAGTCASSNPAEAG